MNRKVLFWILLAVIVFCFPKYPVASLVALVISCLSFAAIKKQDSSLQEGLSLNPSPDRKTFKEKSVSYYLPEHLIPPEIEIAYKDANLGETIRVVTVSFIRKRDNSIEIQGFCQLRQNQRLFKLNRISNMVNTEFCHAARSSCCMKFSGSSSPEMTACLAA
jgi:hypothetical protein